MSHRSDNVTFCIPVSRTYRGNLGWAHVIQKLGCRRFCRLTKEFGRPGTFFGHTPVFSTLLQRLEEGERKAIEPGENRHYGRHPDHGSHASLCGSPVSYRRGDMAPRFHDIGDAGYLYRRVMLALACWAHRSLRLKAPCAGRCLLTRSGSTPYCALALHVCLDIFGSRCITEERVKKANHPRGAVRFKDP